ncbi:hypothetical protein VTL71DRAFT_2148 [Oculimacula yallundae]|uniref:Uncharacterized protein n=1 Tax=Oculimacula yallundae TaxID=86028 RepID=A0ABR4C975_9HELO
MDGHDPVAGTFSFSSLGTRNFRQIYNHKLQWFRWVLGLAAAFHITPNFGKLYWHYFTHHTPSFRPDLISFLLSGGARFTWLFLFRDPAAFLDFKRPGRSYRWVVCGTVALTTLPNGVVHIWAIWMALKNDGIVLAGIWTAILAMIFLVPLAGLVWWMAWRFLLGVEESDEDFEPTVKRGVAVIEHLEPYSDYASAPFTSARNHRGYLSLAYDEQRLDDQEPNQEPDVTVSPEQPHNEESESLEIMTSEQNDDNPAETPQPLRCPTLARFEHMSESHAGPHSWFSYPIFSLVISGYAAILLIGLPIWIHQDREYKLREPSLTLKKSLYLPLGMLLLSFYALKHQIRASLFEHFNIPPPEPWKKMMSILPYWFGTGGTFKNRETGEVTVYDPGRRAFPSPAYNQPALIDTRQYLASFNTNPGACSTYWGHTGRKLKTDFRFRAPIHRFGFLSLALYFTIKGYHNVLFYQVPNVYDEVMKHPKTITTEDVARIIRILRLWQGFAFSGLWFTLMAVVFGLGCMGSVFVLFVRTIWKYVPQEEKDQIIEAQREREREQARDRRRLEALVPVD